jgi:hypothetical protein
VLGRARSVWRGPEPHLPAASAVLSVQLDPHPDGNDIGHDDSHGHPGHAPGLCGPAQRRAGPRSNGRAGQCPSSTQEQPVKKDEAANPPAEVSGGRSGLPPIPPRSSHISMVPHIAAGSTAHPAGGS